MSTYGYEEGLLSNSMLQAAIVCPVKYELLYVKRVQTPDRNGLWFNDAWVGTVAHECIELFDDDELGSINHAWEMVGRYITPEFAERTRRLYAIYQEARRKTIEDGLKWGKTYKAPEMTGFWKRNYSGVDQLIASLSRDIQAGIEGSVFEKPFFELICKMMVSLENWQRLRVAPPIEGGTEVLLQGEVGPEDARTRMVGTADRLEGRGAPKRIALADYKSGRWGYSHEKVLNSDQFGLYDTFLRADGYDVVEWVLYDIFLGERYVVTPDGRVREAFERRLATNLRYFKQLSAMMGTVEVPTPAGSAFKTGCPCILAQTGDCPYYVVE